MTDSKSNTVQAIGVIAKILKVAVERDEPEAVLRNVKAMGNMLNKLVEIYMTQPKEKSGEQA